MENDIFISYIERYENAKNQDPPKNQMLLEISL